MRSTIQAITSTNGSLIWILQMNHAAYALGLDSKGQLQHIYWGAKLEAASDYETSQAYYERRSAERSPAVNREEFPVWGDYSFVEPCLKATYADGVRATLLQYTGYLVTRDGDLETLTIELHDPGYPLKVQLIFRPIPEHNLIERHVAITNTGSVPIVLERIMTAAWTFPRRDVWHLRTLTGKWGGEFQVQEIDVQQGKRVLEHRRGASAFDANPWFSLDAGGAGENAGEVWFGALAFSGNWKMILERTAFGQVTLTGGINDFDFVWHLDSGETFETPVFVGGFTEGGYGEVSRRLHRYQLDYILPSSTAHTLRPVVYNSWYVTGFDVSEEQQVAAAEKAKDLGVEVFIMDDGWYSPRGRDRVGLGDWRVAPDKFPDGLKSMIERINALGLKFGLWTEPETVIPDSDLYRAHPDWVYFFPNRPNSEAYNQYLLNFARADVQAYIFDTLDRLLRENRIDYLKWDMNRHISEPGWLDAPPGREREIWVRHARGVYDVLRRLREAHPHVMVEACSGGGGRVDMGVMRYVDWFWESDNTDPYDDLFMFEGFSQAYAPLTRMRLVTDPNDNNLKRATSLEYPFHVAMMGMLGIGADILHSPDAKLDEARRLVARYKELRQTLQFGDVYRLSSPRSSELAAFQFVRQDGEETVVFAFLHSSRFGLYRAMLRLQGLDPQALYSIDGDDLSVSGQALMKRGIHLDMNGDFVSRMTVIRRIPDAGN